MRGTEWIFKTLKDRSDYEVCPVNPRLESIEGSKVVHDVCVVIESRIRGVSRNDG